MGFFLDNIRRGQIEMRPVFFLLAAVLYGVWGSPTPSAFGMVEMGIGIVLILSIGPARGMRAAIMRQEFHWGQAGQILLLYGLTIPLIAGFMAGNDPGHIIRDLIPFLFLLLPLFVQDWQGASEAGKRMLAGAVAFIGVTFGARVLYPVLGTSGVAHDALYLSIAPTVVFAALFLSGLAGRTLYQGWHIRNVMRACLLLAGALLAFSGLVLTLQRASIGLAVLGLGCLLALALWRNPLRATGPFILLTVVLLAFAPLVHDMTASLLQKQEMVGTNMRVQEAAAVLDAIGGSAWTVLFGEGWGATLASPAVGGETVNFTHNLLTSYWLKTGLTGVCLLVLYLVRLCWPLIGLFRGNPVLAVALAVPLVIDILLYASFKSLDFGLILVVLMVFTAARPRLRGAAA